VSFCDAEEPGVRYKVERGVGGAREASKFIGGKREGTRVMLICNISPRDEPADLIIMILNDNFSPFI